jgi:hypothetical protein
MRGCRCGSHLAAYLALLRLGVTVPPLLPAARWALTPPFHPYPSRPRPLRAVSFLWPCPSPCGAQALPGSLPCGARTFLGRPAASATIVPNQWLEDNAAGSLELGARVLSGVIRVSTNYPGPNNLAFVPAPSSQLPAPSSQLPAPSSQLPAPSYPECPTLASPRRACSTNGWSSGSADLHWFMTCRYSARASARRPSRS